MLAQVPLRDGSLSVSGVRGRFPNDPTDSATGRVVKMGVTHTSGQTAFDIAALDAVIEAARRNGISSPLTPVPSIALGAEEVTPVELVAAYAPFANGGNRVKPRIVARIEAPDGKLLWQFPRKFNVAGLPALFTTVKRAGSALVTSPSWRRVSPPSGQFSSEGIKRLIQSELARAIG